MLNLQSVLGGWPPGREAACAYGVTPRKARRPDPGTWATGLLGGVGISGKAAGFLSLVPCCAFGWTVTHVCHFMLQDCYSGSGWHVSISRCLHLFKPIDTPIWERFPAHFLHLPCRFSRPCAQGVLVWSGAEPTRRQLSFQPNVKEVPVTWPKPWCAQNWSSALGFTLTSHWVKATPVATALQDGVQKLPTKGGPQTFLYTCSKILYNYYIRHSHSHASSTDGEWSVAISLEMGSDAIILPVSCY